MIEITEQKYSLMLKLNQVPNFNKAVEIIKSCPAGRRYLPDTKQWEVALCVENLQALMRIPELFSPLIDIGNRLVPQTLPEQVDPMPFDHVTRPLKHQSRFLPFLIQYQGRGYLVAGAIGTGKTAIVAYLLLNRFQEERVLIIAPNKVKPVWPAELKKHAGINGFTILDGKQSKSKREKLIRGSYKLIVNYESLHCLEAQLIAFQPSVVIADESHRIKNMGAQCTRAFHKISEVAKHVYCLTGTPRSNDDLDLFSQIMAVNPWLWGVNYYSFLHRWFEKRGGFDMNIIGKDGRKKKINTGKWMLKSSREKDFQNMLKYVSVYFPNTVIDLPPVTYTERYTDMPEEVIEKYREVKAGIKAQVEAGETTIYNALSRDSKLLQLASGVMYSGEGPDRRVVFQNSFKAELLLDILENEIEEGAACIVWFNYRHSLDLVEQILEKLGISYLSVHGDTRNVEEVLKEFESNTGIRILLATNVISEGQTILKPTYCIKFDHNFQWLPDFQRTGRNYRQGQTKPVIIIDLVSPGTVEEKAFRALREKEDRCKEILEGLKMEDL